LKLTEDHGCDAGENSFGLCLQNESCVSQNLKSATHYLKLGAYQGNSECQSTFDLCLCLRDGGSIFIDLSGLVDLLKLAADQTHPATRNEYVPLLGAGRGISRDFTESGIICRMKDVADESIAESE
jgi:TPR repeat protein